MSIIATITDQQIVASFVATINVDVDDVTLAGSGGAALIGKASGGTVQDTLTAAEALLDAFAAGATTTVKAGGDYELADFIDALDWLKTQPLNRPHILDITGEVTIPAGGYTFDHPNARNLYIQGHAWAGGQRLPTNADMGGTRATDLATVRGLASAIIRLDGPGGVGGTIGLNLPFGIGACTRILFDSDARYSVSVGFGPSHASATGSTAARFVDCSWFGGVWGLIEEGAFLNLAENGNWFGYQLSGGPIGLFAGGLETDQALLEAYYPTANATDNPKYVIYAEGAYINMNPNNTAGKLKAKGSFLHGFYSIAGTHGIAMSPQFDGVTQPITDGAGAIKKGTPIITNADPANTSMVTGATQPGPPGNEGSGALISIGPGGNGIMAGATITASIASYYVNLQGGKVNGYTPITAAGSKATISAFKCSGSKGSQLACSVGTPQSGSVDQSLCNANGDIYWYAHSGITFSPALNTPTNGSGNYDS